MRFARSRLFHGIVSASTAMALLTIVPVTASAQDPRDIPGYPPVPSAASPFYDPREVARLPRYCRYTQVFRDRVPGGNDPSQISYWYSTMGETFHAHAPLLLGLDETE